MTETAFFASVLTGMALAFIAGLTWGKYARIYRDLGRMA